MASRQGRQSYFRYNNLKISVLRDIEGNVAGHDVGLRTKWYSTMSLMRLCPNDYKRSSFQNSYSDIIPLFFPTHELCMDYPSINIFFLIGELAH